MNKLNFSVRESGNKIVKYHLVNEIKKIKRPDQARSIIENIPSKDHRDYKIRWKKKKRHSTGMTSSESGYIPSLKNNEYSIDKIWEYESKLEHDFYLLLDHDPNCLDFQPQPLSINVSWSNLPIVIDCWAIFKDGSIFLFEIKPYKKLIKLKTDENWLKRQQIVKEICKYHGWCYKEIDETIIRNQRLENIKSMLKAVKGLMLLQKNLISKENYFQSYYDLLEEFTKITRKIITDNDQTLCFGDILDLIANKISISIDWIISLLYYKIYYFADFYIDWDQPLLETPLKLVKIPLEPVHNLEQQQRLTKKILNEIEEPLQIDPKLYVDINILEMRLKPLIDRYFEYLDKRKSIKSKSNQKLQSFYNEYFSIIRQFAIDSDRNISIIYQEFKIWKNLYQDKERLKYYLPIKTKFGLSGKKKAILKFCQTELQWSASHALKAYRLYINHRNLSIDNLSDVDSQSQSRFGDKLENLIEEKIEQWDRAAGSIQRSYFIKNLLLELEDIGYSKINLPSERTLRRRIAEYKNSPTKAKSKSRKAKSITKSIIGYYEDGNYPGAVIQADHTQLDIWVLDELTLQPIARPWLTIALDIYSGAIWGMALSLYEPNGERVVQTIINGISNKKATHEWKVIEKTLADMNENDENFAWEVSGIPMKISFDNGLDFHARAVKQLCSKLNITLSYRATYTPEWAGKVEQFWNIVNSGIRNRKLAGRLFPIDKGRRRTRSRTQFTPPEGYNSKRDSGLTLSEFEQYLFSHLIIEYQNTKHGGESHTPQQIWNDGLEGLNFRSFGGQSASFNPNDIQKYTYMGMNKKKIVLTNKGFRFDNFQYSSKWINKARTFNILKDKEKYEIYYSNWDAEHIWFIESDGKTHVLNASNYYRSKNVRSLVIGAFRKNILIDRKSVKYIQKLVDESIIEDHDNIENIMKKILDKLDKGSKLNKKDKRLIEKLQKGLLDIPTNTSLTEIFMEKLKGKNIIEPKFLPLQNNQVLPEEKSRDNSEQDIPVFGSWGDIKSKINDEDYEILDIDDTQENASIKNEDKEDDYSKLMDDIKSA